jgi:hypothetical protein
MLVCMSLHCREQTKYTPDKRGIEILFLKKTRLVVTMAGASQILVFSIFRNLNMVMGGSILSILPLLILIFLGLPAMILNFAGKSQVVW